MSIKKNKKIKRKKLLTLCFDRNIFSVLVKKITKRSEHEKIKRVFIWWDDMLDCGVCLFLSFRMGK